MKRPEQLLATFLKNNNLTIALAESMTCGLAAHKLGSISGTSDVLAGSIVCYSKNVKTDLLEVSKKLIKKYSLESQQVTNALALNLSKTIRADVHAALTGLAASGGSETKSKPVGTVFYSFLFRGKLYKMKKKFNGSPLEIKEKACGYLFKTVVGQLKKQLT